MRTSRSFSARIWQTGKQVFYHRRLADSKEIPSLPVATKRRLFSSSSLSDQRGSGVVVHEHKAKSSATITQEECITTSSGNKRFGRILNNPEAAESTALVDGLVQYTRTLMDQALTEQQKQKMTRTHTTESDNLNESHVHHIVAFSGGIDSSLVLSLLMEASTAADNGNISQNQTQQQQHQESVHAVMGRSPAVPHDQVILARQVAAHIGIPLVEVSTTEGNDETYIANTGQACLACKTHLYSALQAVAEHAASNEFIQQNHNNNKINNIRPNQQQYHQLHHYHQLYNGTNADDLQDSTRVGLIAANNFHVQSPLQYTTKQQVRQAARHLGLPNWNVAASPCLRSRLALGVQATSEHLQRIEAAERFVRQELDDVVSETSNLRVRLLAGNRAMLEIDSELLEQVQWRMSKSSSTMSSSSSWEEYFVQTLGFASIDARAFRSGSVAKQEQNGRSLNNNATTKQALDSLREIAA